MANTYVYTRDELIAERCAILRKTGRTEQDLHHRAALYMLSDDERIAWETLNDIDYLLTDGDDQTVDLSRSMESLGDTATGMADDYPQAS